MKVMTINLTAGSDSFHSVVGTYFRLLDCTGYISAQFEGNGIKTDVREGLGFTVKKFNGFRLNSPTTQTIKVVVGEGEVNDNSMSGSVNSVNLSPATFTAVPKVTLTASAVGALVAADTDREKVILKADVANAQNVFIGDSGMVTGEGIPLAPGEQIELKTGAAIYGLSTAADTVYIAEVMF